MNSIELLLTDQEFQEIKIYINQELIAHNTGCRSIKTQFNHKLPAQIDVEFWPFKLKPRVRYNDFMLDYWLANILLQDHKLTMNVTINFFSEYRNKNIQGRVESLSEKQKNANHFFDQYIGVNNGYPALVSEIKTTLNK